MFDLSKVQKRYFELKAPDSGKVLHLEPPKLKQLRRLEELMDGANVQELSAAVAMCVSKNREGRRVTAETVMDWMDVDQLVAFLTEYVDWVQREKTTNPN